MNDTEIRERLRDVTGPPAGEPDLRRIERRAHVLRWRRAGAVVVSAALAIAAIAIPLSGLRHIGEGPAVTASPVAEPATGDGRIGFREAAGWSDLRASTTSVCTTSGQIADADRGYAIDAAQAGSIVCIDSAATLPPDGVAFAAWVQSGPYSWSAPTADVPPTTLPLRLDRSMIETHWEGGPNAPISREIIIANVDWRTVVVWAYFGRLDPTDGQLATAQSRLDELFVDAPASLGADVAFAPLDGWTSTTGSSPAFTPYSERGIAATTSNVTLPPADPDSVYPPGLTNNQIDALPADGIAIQAEQLLFTRNPIPSADDPVLTLPLDLRDAKSWTGGGEGLTREDLTQYGFRGSVNGRPIIVQAWFGTAEPSSALVREAQQAIDQLVVVPTPMPTDQIDQFGISMSVPQGWHGLLYQGDPTLIVSTQPIAALYWDESRKTLGPSDVTLTLDESDASVEVVGWAPLDGPPTIGPYERCDGCEALDDGAPPDQGHVLYERTFTTGGRAFTLLVEFGSEPAPSQIEAVNALLSTLTIQPLPNTTETPPPGTTRVGPIYDGEDKPEVSAADPDRRLTWVYEHASMTLPAGWTGQSDPVAGLERPISLLAAGSWDFTPGGYCGPINALRELPADGAFVWVDSYGSNPPDDTTFTPQPTRVDLPAAETDPSPCFGGTAPFVFRWSIGGRYVVVHAALGADASEQTVADAEATLESVGVG
jgi:hypothetical protein